ncbi:MAG: purine-nucleoside phosphorylase [Desulfovibrionaceae bacterium]|jgi:purine-nucleoside phosphorylase|nr:purine-nucleoside phosphorylase [Desulfovibrionaceae bacterium]
MQNFEKVQKAVAFIAKSAAGMPRPRLGMVLGTGLGPAWCGEESFGLEYGAIPGFPPATVSSHAGRLCLGRVGGAWAWALSGRPHLYEGRTPAEVCMGVRVLAGLGVDTLVLTNAAGALNPAFEAGTLMCVADHINLTGANPLTGPNHEGWGERFPDMSAPYDAGLRALAAEEAARLGVRLESGVYAAVPGPSMETPAETRMLRTLGADAVGMSTVLECIAARHMGLRVLGVSCLTNKNDPDAMAPVRHEAVVAAAATVAGDLAALLAALAPRLARPESTR